MNDEAKRCVYALQASIRNGFHSVGNAEFSMRCTEMMHVIESLSAELEQVKRERDAAVEDVRLAVCDDLKCSTCMYKGNESHMCDDCDVYTFCNWQWRGVKEENEC